MILGEIGPRLVFCRVNQAASLVCSENPTLRSPTPARAIRGRRESCGHEGSS